MRIVLQWLMYNDDIVHDENSACVASPAYSAPRIR